MGAGRQPAGPARVVPPILEVKVPGADIVVEMGGEPWRLRRVRNHPPLALLEPHPRSSPASEA